MDFNIVIDIFFKTSAIVLGVIYLLYSIVLSKQVNIMTKTLEDKFNLFVNLISSIQITVAIILLIFAIFLI
jgi:uncharacterized membrane protein